MNKSLFNSNSTIWSLDYPAVMGIINLSPNSFYNSSIVQLDQLLERVNNYIEEGVDLIDLGAMSSKPGSNIPDAQTELSLLLPAIKQIKAAFPNLILSIDTMRSEIAEQAILNGAHMINDISGGQFDPDMPKIINTYQVPYIMMHMRGIPKTMNQPEHLNYTNLSSEIMRFFVAQIKKFKDHGVYQIIVDPGFGFSKSLAQNFELLANLHLLSILDCPILVGISRKSMIYKQTNNDPEDALNGTTAAHMLALMEGAQILRVHDVKAAKQAVSIFNKYTKHKVINLS